MLLAKCKTADGKQYSLPELTTSGLTHSWQDYPSVATFGMKTIHTVARSPFQFNKHYYLDRNFGEIEIKDDSVILNLFNKHGQLQFSEEFQYKDLKQPNYQGGYCTSVKTQHIVRRYLNLFVALIAIFIFCIMLPLFVMKKIFL